MIRGAYCVLKTEELKIEHFQDDHSAKNFNRPAFQRFIQQVQTGEVQCSFFVFYKMDRFSRDLFETIRMFGVLKDKKIKIFSVLEGELNFDDLTQFFPNLISAASAQMDNMQRAENTKRGMMEGLKQGRWMWHAPYGYENNKEKRTMTVVEAEADIVRFCFKQYSTGAFSVEEVRLMACNRGLKRSPQSFTNVLRNPLYAGLIRRPALRDEPEQLVEAIHQPIITKQLYDEVQDLLDGKKKSYKKELHTEELQLRPFLICPKCRNIMTGSRSSGNGANTITIIVNQKRKEDVKTGTELM